MSIARILALGCLFAVLTLSALVLLNTQNQPLRAYSKHPEFKLFNDWQVEYSKVYKNELETIMRFGVWLSNHYMIEEVNARKLNYTFGHNQFSDLTQKEVSEQLSCLVSTDESIEPTTEEGGDIPSEVDWKAAGAVTPVQNQGQCGSCWAFASVATLEGAYYQATTSLQKFSEQQLVDCTRGLNWGCNGGQPFNVFNWYQNHKAVLSSCYPYVGKDQTCKSGCEGQTRTKGGVRVPLGENNLAASVAKRVNSVLINASPITHYRSGVFDGICTAEFNHAITVVGYTQKYWLLKNSWGTKWGEGGFIRIAKKSDNAAGKCGLAKFGSYTKIAV